MNSVRVLKPLISLFNISVNFAACVIAVLVTVMNVGNFMFCCAVGIAFRDLPVCLTCSFDLFCYW